MPKCPQNNMTKQLLPIRKPSLLIPRIPCITRTARQHTRVKKNTWKQRLTRRRLSRLILALLRHTIDSGEPIYGTRGVTCLVDITNSHAQYCLGHFKEAAAAFRRGVELDPSNASLKSGLKNAEARIVPDAGGIPPLEADNPVSDPASSTGLGGMAEMLRGLGGGSAGGGMPDLASMMNNPMMMQMAQQMMANGGLERLMQNPALANMVSSSTVCFHPGR